MVKHHPRRKQISLALRDSHILDSDIVPHAHAVLAVEWRGIVADMSCHQVFYGQSRASIVLAHAVDHRTQQIIDSHIVDIHILGMSGCIAPCAGLEHYAIDGAGALFCSAGAMRIYAGAVDMAICYLQIHKQKFSVRLRTIFGLKTTQR